MKFLFSDDCRKSGMEKWICSRILISVGFFFLKLKESTKMFTEDFHRSLFINSRVGIVYLCYYNRFIYWCAIWWFNEIYTWCLTSCLVDLKFKILNIQLQSVIINLIKFSWASQQWISLSNILLIFPAPKLLMRYRGSWGISELEKLDSTKFLMD